MPAIRRRTAAGATLLAATVLGSAASAGCGARPRERQEPDAPVPAAATLLAVPSAQVAPVNPEKLRHGPGDPERGVPYPFDLDTRCGIRYATFDLRVWRAVRPRSAPIPRRDAEGRVHSSDYTAGTMTLVDARTAQFVMDSRWVTDSNTVVLFRPSQHSPRTACD